MASDSAPALIDIEVAYSPTPRAVDLVSLRVAPGTTVLQAVRSSGLLSRHPSISPADTGVGIWGRSVGWSQPVAAGDRIELYRALRVDPKEARRQRYRAQGERGRRKPGRRT